MNKQTQEYDINEMIDKITPENLQEPVAYADDIEEMVQRLQNWCEAYPTDIFPEITKEEIDYINAQNKNLSGKYFAHVGRHFIAKGLKPALDLLLRIYNTHPAQPLTRDWIGTALERADKDEAFRKGLIGELAQPLSDDEVNKMAKYQANSILIDLIKDDDWNKGCTKQHLINFARAIEQAHGIGEKDGQAHNSSNEWNISGTRD